ncbi:ferritin-like domain-containing protein [Qaidamihabitans albus]|uniref:ferritin-like domain-containing protein n=1 Tax=Qaidamihabitans albus TaxID=2795733 RepID=UPI0018F1105D|nr:ferritin-like domain-containing protein [Qaidamihabitans albus]
MISRSPFSRRQVLRAAALTALTAPLAAACTTGYEDAPDPLAPLLARARADAAAANALAGSAPEHAELARQVAGARSAQADALAAEVDRLNRPEAENTTAPPAKVADLAALGQRLTEARDGAAGMVPGLPPYRAGLVGSVAAGCAALQQLAPELGAGQPGEVDRVSTGPLTEAAVTALQDALAAEHAAVWVYGLVSAFLPADFGKGIDEGADAHRDRRDACERVLTDAGAAPRPPEPAYLPPDPVTDAASAQELVITAEADAAEAWHGVLERTEDKALRTLAMQALTGSATRGTSWRMEAGKEPQAVALPGRA